MSAALSDMPQPAALIDSGTMMLNFGSSFPPFTNMRFSSTKVDTLAVQFVEPRMLVPLGKPEEQAFDLYVVTGNKQGVQPPRATQARQKPRRRHPVA